MKIVTFVFLLVLPALAAESEELMNIHKGNWEVQGSFDLNHSSPSSSYGSYSSLSFGGAAGYFFADHFSVGIETWYGSTFGESAKTSSTSVGPTLTYYFLTGDRSAPYFYISPLRVSSGSYYPSNLDTQARIGNKFFLTESVAFGPALQFEHHWPRDNSRGFNEYALLGIFSIHL
jgi:hypothetical protein